MTDSSSFSSLFALVDSHLSKCNLNETPSEGAQVGSMPIPMFNVQRGLSDTELASPPQRLPIPSFSLSESPIANVLSEQLSNMLKAKELKKQQEIEQVKIKKEIEKLRLEEKSCVIDLMKAVQKPGQSQPRPESEQVLSSSSSFESLAIDNSEFTVGSPKTNTEEIVLKPPEPLLPITNDMSYMLKQKIKAGKCSAFGKVISSRLRPVAAPYLSEKITTNIIRFDFKTKSPCDLIKEKLKRKPTHSISNTYHDFF